MLISKPVSCSISSYNYSIEKLADYFNLIAHIFIEH